MSRGKPIGTTFGNLLQCVIYHCTGTTRARTRRSANSLARTRLPQFVGDIDNDAPYRPEPAA